ncbi:MAG: hypothetical protein UZ15_CFX003000248 [Chloroflexi bacterium OLB15]|nr:MAG: hypothetical protein UZ15_CFX003000248 [Chloroflexi bacterium OLB15]
MIGATMAAVEGITMDIARVLALYDQQERREMRYPDAVREVVPPVMRHINVPGRRSFIIYSTLDESNADETIAREAAFLLNWGAIWNGKPTRTINPPIWNSDCWRMGLKRKTRKHC